MIDINKIPNIALQPEDEAWLTGFSEGDGWLTFYANNGGFILAYEQKERQVLDYIRELLSPWSKGSMFEVNWGCWRLSYASKYFTAGMMKLFSRHVVTPKWCSTLNTKTNNISWPWFVGFFDADGHSGLIEGSNLNKNLFIGVGQKDIEVPERIRAFLGKGSVQSQFDANVVRHLRGGDYIPGFDHFRLSVTTTSTSELITNILKYSHNSRGKEKLLTHMQELVKWQDVMKAVRQSAQKGGDANAIS